MSKASLLMHVREIGYSDIDAVLDDLQLVAAVTDIQGDTVMFHLEGLTGHPSTWPCRA